MCISCAIDKLEAVWSLNSESTQSQYNAVDYFIACRVFNVMREQQNKIPSFCFMRSAKRRAIRASIHGFYRRVSQSLTGVRSRLIEPKRQSVSSFVNERLLQTSRSKTQTRGAVIYESTDSPADVLLIYSLDPRVKRDSSSVMYPRSICQSGNGVCYLGTVLCRWQPCPYDIDGFVFRRPF